VAPFLEPIETEHEEDTDEEAQTTDKHPEHDGTIWLRAVAVGARAAEREYTKAGGNFLSVARNDPHVSDVGVTVAAGRCYNFSGTGARNGGLDGADVDIIGVRVARELSTNDNLKSSITNSLLKEGEE
jgi:hypothetical protein